MVKFAWRGRLEGVSYWACEIYLYFGCERGLLLLAVFVGLIGEELIEFFAAQIF